VIVPLLLSENIAQSSNFIPGKHPTGLGILPYLVGSVGTSGALAAVIECRLLPFLLIIDMQGPTGADLVELERDLSDVLFSSVVMAVVVRSGAEGRSRRRL
jgi:hypothetical protein